MATKRTGKPYIYATWLAKLLGGQQCTWSAWFKAHHKYDKFEEQALDLVKWNRDHTKLMAAREKALRLDGWTVFVEEENAFKLEGAAANRRRQARPRRREGRAGARCRRQDRP